MAQLLEYLPNMEPRIFENSLNEGSPHVLLSMYGGVGHVAEMWAAAAPGSSMLYDHAFCATCDLGTPEASEGGCKIIRHVNKAGSLSVSAVGIDLPCESWSQARGGGKGPPAIRSGDYILGLPGVRPHDQRKLDHGNTQIEIAAEWIKTCLQMGTPGYLENPARSWVWQTEQIAELLQLGCRFEELDQCQYGRPFRKATKLLVWGSTTAGHSFLKCRYRNHQCSRSGEEHVHLRGLDADGQFKTKAAQEYPVELARALVKMLRG
jgi:hypothetical protein